MSEHTLCGERSQAVCVRETLSLRRDRTQGDLLQTLLLPRAMNLRLGKADDACSWKHPRTMYVIHDPGDAFATHVEPNG